LWLESADKSPQCNTFRAHVFAQKIAQWAADQELQACCEWLKGDGWCGSIARLHAARRPKPPSLKQQALEQFAHVLRENDCITAGCILAALEALPDDPLQNCQR